MALSFSPQNPDDIVAIIADAAPKDCVIAIQSLTSAKQAAPGYYEQLWVAMWCSIAAHRCS